VIELIDTVKIIAPAVVAFSIGIAITPAITYYLYKYRVWKVSPGKVALDGTEAMEFNKIHREKEAQTPRMGGVVIWFSVLATVLSIALLAILFPESPFSKLDFLSRDQTWIPVAVLAVGAVVGFVSDLLDVRGSGRGMPLSARLLVILALSLFVGWWFWDKLDVVSVGVPFVGPFEIGWLIIPLFVLVSIALYASGVIDGIDGLSGGVFASIFASYAIIAFFQSQINLAAFSATVVGAVLAFLWFNIPPARFYMTETGTMGLTLALVVVAFMTDATGEGIGISVLPIIGFLLVATVASNVVQIASKKIYGRKVFRVAPLHHHFEAVGWPGYKVVMRYWVLSVIFAFIGVIVALLGA